MPNTKVNVKGFLEYLSLITDEQYAKNPMLDNCKTRRAALRYLRNLADKGMEWIE